MEIGRERERQSCQNYQKPSSRVSHFHSPAHHTPSHAESCFPIQSSRHRWLQRRALTCYLVQSKLFALISRSFPSHISSSRTPSSGRALVVVGCYCGRKPGEKHRHTVKPWAVADLLLQIPLQKTPQDRRRQGRQDLRLLKNNGMLMVRRPVETETAETALNGDASQPAAEIAAAMPPANGVSL